MEAVGSPLRAAVWPPQGCCAGGCQEGGFPSWESWGLCYWTPHGESAVCKAVNKEAVA